jgi:hypothetical protein
MACLCFDVSLFITPCYPLYHPYGPFFHNHPLTHGPLGGQLARNQSGQLSQTRTESERIVKEKDNNIPAAEAADRTTATATTATLRGTDSGPSKHHTNSGTRTEATDRPQSRLKRTAINTRVRCNTSPGRTQCVRVKKSPTERLWAGFRAVSSSFCAEAAAMRPWRGGDGGRSGTGTKERTRLPLLEPHPCTHAHHSLSESASSLKQVIYLSLS